MQKLSICFILITAVAGCNANAPVSNPGPGFVSYDDMQAARAQRDAVLNGQSALDYPQVGTSRLDNHSNEASDPVGDADGDGRVDVVTNARAIDDANLRTGQIQANPNNAQPKLVGTEFSDEQDFAAVSGRETVESDAKRRADLAAQYQVIQPDGLPERPNSGPNITAYALSALNVLGQEWYSRFALSGQSRFERNCASYNTPDDAQRDFLSRGGPERDPRGIDPDGDGFACGWDPTPIINGARRAN